MITYEFTDGIGNFTVTQKDGATAITQWQFAKHLAFAKVQDGRVIVHQDEVNRIDIARSMMTPPQASDSDATAFLRSLIFS